MQFQVPQFIDVEDKVFGPFTFKQFIYLLGGAGAGFVIWRLVSIKIVALLLIAPIGGLALLLAFQKINNRPFIEYLQSVLLFYSEGKQLYKWKKEEKKPVTKLSPTAQTEPLIPKITSGKIKDVAWGLDINERINKTEEQ